MKLKMSEEKKVTRRKFLNYAAAGAAVGLAAGAAGGYYGGLLTAQPSVTTQTVTQTVTASPTVNPTLPYYETAEYKAIIEAAKSEGKLVHYYTTFIEYTENLLNEFKKKYPFIKTESLRASGSKMYEKFSSEMNAGIAMVDVIQISMIQALEEWIPKGWLLEYASPEAPNIRSGMKRSPYWYGSHICLLGPCWNTKLVTPEDAPKTWWDVADPKWKGKLGLAGMIGGTAYIPNYVWRYVYEKDYGLPYWQGQAANNPAFYESHAPGVLRLVAEEYSLIGCCTDEAMVPQWSKGSPLRWTYPDPAPTHFEGIAISKKSPNPNCAKLFVDWYLSKEGQEAWMNLGGLLTTRTDLTDIRPVAKEPWYKHPQTMVPIPDWVAYAAQLQAMITEWKEVFKFPG